MCIMSDPKDQVINSIASPETCSILQDWQNVWDTNHINYAEVPEINNL